MPRTLPHRLLLPALAAAIQAGKKILQVYQGDIDVTYKEDDSPLTVADRKAHQTIVNFLCSVAYTNIPILSEEGKHIRYKERTDWEYFWLVDPLDGTKEFIQRRDEFTVNIALIEKTRPVAGIVYPPAVGSLYLAAEGLGSFKFEDVKVVEQGFLDQQGTLGRGSGLQDLVELAIELPLHRAAKSYTDRLNLVGSRLHGTEDLADFVDKMKQEYSDVEFVSAGSALKFCLVAEGSADLYPRFGPTMEWDTAAGQCMVEQSGGTVLSMKEKRPLAYNKRDLHNPHFVCIGRSVRNLRLPL
jgi:3'(2'), 5'-bisphosphate nucleotidase